MDAQKENAMRAGPFTARFGAAVTNELAAFTPGSRSMTRWLIAGDAPSNVAREAAMSNWKNVVPGSGVALIA